MDFLYFLQNIRTVPLNYFSQFCTYLGQDILLIVLICATYWCIDKILASKICFSYFAAGLVVQGLKVTFRIKRPFLLDNRLKPVESAIPAATGYSFPSGHTQSATSIYSMLAFNIKNKFAKIALFVVIFLIGFSRMYLGVHTPKDVLTSFCLSLLISFITYKIFDKIYFSDKNFKLTFILVEIVSVLLIFYTLYLAKNDTVSEIMAMDCFKACGGTMGFIAGCYFEKKYINFSTKCDKKYMQVVKLVAGLFFVVVIKSGLPLIIGKGILANIVRYFLITLWLTLIYPFFIKKFLNGSAR